MILLRPDAEIFIPDGLTEPEALARCTDLVVAAHQDDVEIMAFRPILDCFQNDTRWLVAVIVTDGAGSARSGVYADYSDAEMRTVRRKEQKKAAIIGEYGALALLDFPSSVVKEGANPAPVQDLTLLLRATRPERVFTHNLADKHDTHVAVALRVIDAIRALPEESRPKQLLGCEVWRDLDWLPDADKVLLDCTPQEGLQAALLGVFDSQIAGGKRYDLATLGRRRAHATYLESHATDQSTGITLAMDLTPLIEDHELSPASFAQTLIERFADDVRSRLHRVAKQRLL